MMIMVLALKVYLKVRCLNLLQHCCWPFVTALANQNCTGFSVHGDGQTLLSKRFSIKVSQLFLCFVTGLPQLMGWPRICCSVN